MKEINIGNFETPDSLLRNTETVFPDKDVLLGRLVLIQAEAILHSDRLESTSFKGTVLKAQESLTSEIRSIEEEDDLISLGELSKSEAAPEFLLERLNNIRERVREVRQTNDADLYRALINAVEEAESDCQQSDY